MGGVTTGGYEDALRAWRPPEEEPSGLCPLRQWWDKESPREDDEVRLPRGGQADRVPWAGRSEDEIMDNSRARVPREGLGPLRQRPQSLSRRCPEH